MLFHIGKTWQSANPKQTHELNGKQIMQNVLKAVTQMFLWRSRCWTWSLHLCACLELRFHPCVDCNDFISMSCGVRTVHNAEIARCSMSPNTRQQKLKCVYSFYWFLQTKIHAFKAINTILFFGFNLLKLFTA